MQGIVGGKLKLKGVDKKYDGSDASICCCQLERAVA